MKLNMTSNRERERENVTLYWMDRKNVVQNNKFEFMFTRDYTNYQKLSK